MTRKLTISGAFLVMVGLLVTFGNADDTPKSSAPAPAEIQLPQSAAPIVLAKKETDESLTASDDLAAETTSVLTVNPEDTAADPVVLDPVAVGETEPMLFDPPAELSVGESTESDAFVVEETTTENDEFPLVSGSAADSANDVLESTQENVPIVAPDTEGLEFQVFSNDGSVLPTESAPALVPQQAPQFDSVDSGNTQISNGIQTTVVQAPQISITSQGPGVIRVGELGEYLITATNSGTTVAEDLFLVTHIPEWIGISATSSDFGEVDQLESTEGAQLQWALGALGAGERATWKVKLAPEKNRPFSMDIKWTIQPQVIVNQIDAIQPELQLSIDGPEVMTYGDTRIVEVRVSNTGNGDAEDVILKISPGIERGQKIGALPIGASKVIELELTAEQPGVMEINASVVADGKQFDEKSLDIQIRRPELNVAVNGPAKKFAGSPVTYRIEVANTGDTAAKDVIVYAVLPPSAQYKNGADQLQQGRRNLSWKIGTVEAAATRAFEFNCVLMQDGQNQLSVRVEAVAAESRTAQYNTQVTGVADLKLTINDPPGPKLLDELAVYEIKVVNRGTKTATNIEVVGQFGYGIEPVKTEGGRADLIPGQAVFNPIDSLGPGKEVVLKVYAKASKPGRHKFRAVVKSNDPETSLVQEEMTWFHAAETAEDGPVILTADGAGQ